MGSKGTSVRLREKKLKSGRLSLYLQFYNSDTNKVFTLRQAFTDGIILDNPARKVKNIKHIETHREYLIEEEIQKLFVTDCRDLRIKNSFLFGVLTGLGLEILKD